MARPISEEELQLKKRARRRLIGALVLVTTAAVVLPMVLDPEPKSFSQNVDIQIPSPEAGEFKPKGVAASNPTASTAIAQGAQRESGRGAVSEVGKEPPVELVKEPQGEQSGKGSQRSSGKPERPLTSAKAESSAAPAPSKRDAAPLGSGMSQELSKEPASESNGGKVAAKSPAKEGAPKEAPNAGAGAYVVQIAALADTAKAKRLEKKISSAGLKTYTEVVNSQGGEVTRVRAGPYPTREAAEKARKQLKKSGLDGTVVSQ